MDDIDRSDDAQNRLLEQGLRFGSAPATNEVRLSPIGYCHFCELELTGRRRFCDNDCKIDYEKLANCVVVIPKDDERPITIADLI